MKTTYLHKNRQFERPHTAAICCRCNEMLYNIHTMLNVLNLAKDTSSLEASLSQIQHAYNTDRLTISAELEFRSKIS